MRVVQKTRYRQDKVAEFVGCDNPYYFARLFKRRTGAYPSEVSTSS